MRLFTVDNASLGSTGACTLVLSARPAENRKMSADKYLGICLSLLLLFKLQNTGLSTQCWEDPA